jgi:hypothetical protein
MKLRPPGDAAAAGADSETASRAADNTHGQSLIALMLFGAAGLDLTRCGLVVVTARHMGAAAWLIAAGLGAAAVSIGAAHRCRGGRRWSAPGALLIGAASVPQAAASGFHAPFTIPDTATAVLGVLVAVAVLATAGRPRPTERSIESSCALAPGGFDDRPAGRDSRRHALDLPTSRKTDNRRTTLLRQPKRR